jgi:hypothetical protein
MLQLIWWIQVGLEPTAFPVQKGCTACCASDPKQERKPGFEPRYLHWKCKILPLNYFRFTKRTILPERRIGIAPMALLYKRRVLLIELSPLLKQIKPICLVAESIRFYSCFRTRLSSLLGSDCRLYVYHNTAVV